jgi:hypothetical protein
VTRIFVSLKEFDTLWKGIGFDDGDLREVETFLIVNPQYGKVISATGGLRKMRWALPGIGKSGGIRILYVDFPEHEVLYFISLIKKNEKENISKEDKKTISQIIELIEKNLRTRKEQGGSGNEKNKRKK